MTKKTNTDRVEVSGEKAVGFFKKARRFLDERTCSVQKKEKVIIKLSLARAAIIAIILPHLTLVGVIIALLTQCSIIIEHTGKKAAKRTAETVEEDDEE